MTSNSFGIAAVLAAGLSVTATAQTTDAVEGTLAPSGETMAVPEGMPSAPAEDSLGQSVESDIEQAEEAVDAAKEDIDKAEENIPEQTLEPADLPTGN